MRNDPEKDEKDWKRTDELHNKYRASGLALTVLIVTLSGGAINALRPQGWLGVVLFLPIALSISHQACLYMGQQHEARASHHWFIASMKSRNLQDADQAPGDRARVWNEFDSAASLGRKHNALGVRWFTWADRLCLAAVLVFVICGTIAATQLPPATK